MATLPRESKYRHIFNDTLSADHTYTDIKPDLFGESQHIAVNEKYWAVAIQSSGGGSFMVHPISEPGRIPLNHFVFNYHQSHILELAFNPFETNIIATCSDDCFIKLGKVPKEMKVNIRKEEACLEGHSKKVTVINWHPTATNVLASAGNDKSLIIWDAEAGQIAIDIDDHTDLIYSLAWNETGRLIASSCQDKIIRVMDPRDEEEKVLSVEGHGTKKVSRVFWVNNREMIGSVGFTKEGFRELLFYDIRKMKEPFNKQRFDRQSSKFFPYFEEGNDILFLAGKGDSSMRAYELSKQQGFCHMIAEMKSTQPQKGVAIMPRKNIETTKGEILRVFRLLNNSIEQMSVCVPRRNASKIFQSDLYPDCYDNKPAMSIDDYFDGKNEKPKLISLNKSRSSKAKTSRFLRRGKRSTSKRKEKTPDESSEEDSGGEERRRKEAAEEKQRQLKEAEEQNLRRKEMEERKTKEAEERKKRIQRRRAMVKKRLDEQNKGKEKTLEGSGEETNKAGRGNDPVRASGEVSALKAELVAKNARIRELEQSREKERGQDRQKAEKERKELEEQRKELAEERKRVEELNAEGENSEEMEKLERRAKKYRAKLRRAEKEQQQLEKIIDKQAETIKTLSKRISELGD